MHEELYLISGDHILLVNFGAVIVMAIAVTVLSFYKNRPGKTAKPILKHRPF